MISKAFGAALIIAGCSGTGISIANALCRREAMLKQLIQVIEFMTNELQYRLTPLPDLCIQAGNLLGGALGRVFLNLEQELELRISSDVCNCMEASIAKETNLPVEIRQHLTRLGNVLGRYDLPGQLQLLHSVCSDCRESLRILKSEKKAQIRFYRSLGICTGAVLTILLA